MTWHIQYNLVISMHYNIRHGWVMGCLFLRATSDLCFASVIVVSHAISCFITHAPLFWEGEDYVCESPLGDSTFAMNIHNPFMHCVTSQYVLKLCDVIMQLHAVTMAQHINSIVRHTVTKSCLFKRHVSPRFINTMKQIANLKNM